MIVMFIIIQFSTVRTGNNSEWNTFVEHVAVVWRYYFTWVLKSTDGHRTLVVR